MLYVAMHIIPLIWAKTANILRSPAHDDSMVDAWVRQQPQFREAIAQAKSKNAPAKPADSDDEWVDPWVRQQTRLREAIAQAMRKNLAAKSRDAQ
jgi:hypothetical protein